MYRCLLYRNAAPNKSLDVRQKQLLFKTVLLKLLLACSWFLPTSTPPFAVSKVLVKRDKEIENRRREKLQ